MSNAAMRRRLAPLLVAILVGLFAFAWLDRLNPSVFPINDDPIRDQLLVRDCTDLGACHRLGALSSFGDLYHGAVWIDLLIAIRLLGGDLAAQRLAVLAGLALSASALFIVVWHWLTPSMALPAAVVLIATLSFDTPATLLINPSLAVLPDVLTAAALLCYGLSRQRRFLLVAAFSLGVAVSMHTASFGLLAPFLVIVAMARPRAWSDVMLAGAIAALTFAVPSGATLRANLLALAKHDLLLPIVAAGLVVALISMILGARFRSSSWNTRAWIMAIIMVVPFALILAWFAHRHQFSVIYLHPILGPAAVTVAAIMALPFEGLGRWARPLRWVPTIGMMAGAAIVALNVQRSGALSSMESGAWNLGEAAVIADRAAARGWSYNDLALHLQGTACRDLLTGMSMILPAPSIPPHDGRRQLQVLKAPRDTFAARGDLIALGSNAALLREIESWLQPRLLKACHVPVAAGASPLCTVATPMTADVYTPERFLFLNRSFPLIERFDRQRPYIATYEIPLSPTAGETRDLAVTDEPAPCRWQITRVEGVQVEGPLPGRRVRLHAVSAGAGLVVFEKSFGTPGCPPGDPDFRYPPCVLETEPDDPLQDLVGQS